jgi:large subunit ribosomal protein L29
MKSDEIHNLSDNQLREQLEANRQELFNLRFQVETRKIKNHQRIPEVKKDIARIMTALRERELMREFGGVEAEQETTAATVTTEQAPRRRGLFGRK